MALTILIKTMEDIKNIKLPKIISPIRKNQLIKSAKSKAFKKHLVNRIECSQIIDMARFFTAAKQMNILKNDDIIGDSSISTKDMEINIVYCANNSAVIRVRMKSCEVIYSITDSIKISYTDNRNPEHSYRFTNVYDELTGKHDGWKNDNKEIIRVECYGLMIIIFKLIINLIFDNL